MVEQYEDYPSIPTMTKPILKGLGIPDKAFRHTTGDYYTTWMPKKGVIILYERIVKKRKIK